MATSAANNKRIAKNTMLLYVRMFFIMAIQLYTSRVVINTLGVVDYGIYNVVGGIVTMFAFLDSAMISSTQRYITFELGTGNKERLRTVFTTSIQIHAMISLIIVILGETIGLWFFYNKMVIPPERMHAAMWVFQLSIVAMVVQIMSAPYNALIIAHERMGVFAVISIIEVVLKLAIVFLLLIGNFDRLILYAILILLTQLLVRAIYTTYCRLKIPESKLVKGFEKDLVKEMAGFAGWNLMGNFAAVMYSTGLNLLLNVFFGPAVNAARAVAVQVEGAIQKFAGNFQTAANPQITKLYAQDNKEEMHKLLFRSSKLSFFLLLVFMLPIAVEAEPILTLWLKLVPDHTVVFMRLLFCITLVNTTAGPITTSAIATGDIKKYQFIISFILLTIVPFSWVALKLGGQPYMVYAVMLGVCSVAFAVRLHLVSPMIGLRAINYVKHVILPCAGVTLTSFIITVLAAWALSSLSWGWVIVCVLGGSATVCMAFFIGLTATERQFVWSGVKGFLGKNKAAK